MNDNYVYMQFFLFSIQQNYESKRQSYAYMQDVNIIKL